MFAQIIMRHRYVSTSLIRKYSRIEYAVALEKVSTAFVLEITTCYINMYNVAWLYSIKYTCM